MIEQLSNESILLLYMADELPAQDRAEVDAMLSTDPQLRAQLDEMLQAQQVFAKIERADLLATLPVSEAVAVRRIGRMIRQWQLTRDYSPIAETQPMQRARFPWWCYPLATAAAAVFALVVWWGNPAEISAPVSPGQYVYIENGVYPEALAQAADSWNISAEPAGEDPNRLAMNDEDLSNVLSSEGVW